MPEDQAANTGLRGLAIRQEQTGKSLGNVLEVVATAFGNGDITREQFGAMMANFAHQIENNPTLQPDQFAIALVNYAQTNGFPCELALKMDEARQGIGARR